jgi:biotin carboxyl carrier protein
MYKISTGTNTFDVAIDRLGTSGKANEVAFNFDVVKQNENSWHLLHNNKSYNIQIAKADIANKAFVIVVNGMEYEVKAKDDFDILLDKLGLSNLTQHKVNNIKAPMPGLVLEILVEVGQAVEKDTQLLILEAMKMENVLKSPAAGVVKKIEVVKGQAVEKNYVLLTFE